MKKNIFVTTLIIAAISLFAFKPLTDVKELILGSPIPKPDLAMTDVVSGKEISLNDAKDEKGLLVIFSCNTCPYVKLSELRIKECAAQAKKAGIGVVIVNSNEALREEEDSKEAMTKYAKAQKFNFSYIIDKDSELADAFGAKRTPQVFLFDTTGLVYKGAIDDNIKDISSIKENYLKNALTAVATGKSILPDSTRSIGCSIKRKEN